MDFKSVNPANGELLTAVAAFTADELESALQQAAQAAPHWSEQAVEARCRLMRQAAKVLRARAEELARMMTLEMGKPISEARAEIEKCALGCEYYAADGPAFLADEEIGSDAGRSLVTYQPLGTVLAVMP